MKSRISRCRRVSGTLSPERKPKANLPENRPNASMPETRLDAILTATRDRVAGLRAHARELESPARAAPAPRPLAHAPSRREGGVVAAVARRTRPGPGRVGGGAVGGRAGAGARREPDGRRCEQPRPRHVRR